MNRTPSGGQFDSVAYRDALKQYNEPRVLT